MLNLKTGNLTTQHWQRAALLAVSLGIVGVAQADVAPFTAVYQFNIENKYNGMATRTLSKNGNQYNYNVRANVGKLASARQAATFGNIGGVVQPLTSSTQYKVLGVGNTTDLRFNPTTKQVTTTHKGKTQTLPLKQAAYDDLSLEVQIREDLKNNRFRGNYAMVGRNKVEAVPFTMSAPTRLSVPAGTFDVVRIDRIHDDKDRQTSFWLAPALDYLPVKVVQTNDGRRMEMNLVKLN